MAPYHTAMHLRIIDGKTGAAVDGAVKTWQENRNVLGYFDGWPIKNMAARSIQPVSRGRRRSWAGRIFEF